jgi:hypothetical protein
VSGAHTPGPWRVNRPERILGCDTRGQRYIHAKDVTVAAMLDGEREANAVLIAAAPELLHELRLLNVDERGEQRRNTPAWRAIAKATGSAA